MDKIITDLDQYTGQNKKFIKNTLHDQFGNFKLYTIDLKLAATRNKIEDLFYKTMSKKLKRKYGTNEGIFARIYLNEQ